MATFALRIRVSMSATGSVIIARPPSPRRLRHAWDLTGMGHLTQADATQAEVAVHRPRTATPPATCVHAHLELRLALLLVDEGLLRHALTPAEFRAGGTGSRTSATRRGLRRWCGPS